MKKTIFALSASVLMTLGAHADTTITAWTFDNVPLGLNASPQASTGSGTATALGMGNSFNSTNSISNPDVQSLAGSSTDPLGPNAWRIRGFGAAPNGGNGWSTNAPIGTQGAKFAASSAGFYKIKVTFDVNATPDAEANLLIQYTTEGTIWHDATAISAGAPAMVVTNFLTNSTIMDTYVVLTNNGGSGWNNQIVADLSGISGVDNNPNFAVRIVNASTGTNCVDTTGAPFSGVSGNWNFDNVTITGVSFDTVAGWTFESQGTTAFVPHPAPEFGSGTATSIGFDTTYHFADGSIGSTNKPDTLANGAPFSSSGSAGQIVWRVRGQGPGNGWDTQAPIGSQGGQFDVSTVNYNDVMVSFDLFFTTQGEAKMCVLYTTDGWMTTNVANNLFYAANPTFILTNSVSSVDYSPDTVNGTYFYQTTGQNFYNNLTVDFTGVPNVANNPLFGFRVVNAAQNGDCVAFNGGTYNNSSGNCRFDNVIISGTFNGSVAPAITADTNATVDAPFTNTFTDVPAWRSGITAIYVNGTALTNTAYNLTVPGQITYTPSASALLKTSGVKSIVIFATGFSNGKVIQNILAGAATKLSILTQPAAPSASGGTLVVNPSLAITDQYGNGTAAAPNTNVTVTASVGGTGAWTLGGATNQPATNGFLFFTNLTATVNGSTSVSGAFITFTVNGFGGAGQITLTNSSTFTIGAPSVNFTRGNLAVIQIDSIANNTTFSVIEIKPSANKQTTPVNIVPISATGTNALRLTSAGSAGRLSLSDDGTLISFVGFADGNAQTADETFVLDRAVGTLNYTNAFTSPIKYTSVSLGGSQGRACTTQDNTNWIVIDKGGLYIDNFFWSAQNNVAARTFGGTHYVETQKTAGGSPIPVVYALAMNGPDNIDHAVPNNLLTDPVAVDFYMISTNGGASYDVLYILDQISSTLGVVHKYSWVPDDSQLLGFGWADNGSFTNGNGADSLFAATNGNGGVYLYYTTGGGGTAGNSVVRLTDSGTFNTPITIISSNVIYTASGTTSIKGLTFVPQQTAYAAELIPPPVLLAQTSAATNAPFNITNSPDDALWRGSITGITVNGSLLPTAAYNTNVAGKLVFDPSQSALLQNPGSKIIVISAVGYSTNSITQLVAGAPAKLAITTQPKAPAADGGALATQPVVAVQDASGNPVVSTASILATPVQATWSLGGTSTKSANNGTATFNNLTAFSSNSVTGATITFSSAGLTSVTSSAFNIPAPIHSTLTGATADASGNFVFNFTNATGLSFSILATNNITAPVSTWPVVGVAVENPAGSGHYNYTNSAATNDAQYYILRQP